MENQKRNRSAKRTGFTRTYNAIVALLAQQQPNLNDINAHYAVLRDKAVELQGLNEAILQVMGDDDATAEAALIAELTSCDEYELKYQQIKQQVLQLIDPPQPVQQQLILDNTQMNQTVRENNRYRLPKIEIQKFSGEIKDWLPFWSQFKSIHEDEILKREQKFQYLIQAMTPGTRAHDVIRSFPPTAENYEKAVESLQSRFGKNEMLIEIYVRELLQLVLNTAGQITQVSIVNIYDKLETHLRSLESLGVTTEMCAAMLYPLVESALPADTLRAWQRDSTSTGIDNAKDRLNTLMKFLQTEVETEQRIAMAAAGFGFYKQVEESKERPKKRQSTEAKGIATAAGLLATDDNPVVECIFCREQHHSSECEKARKMTLGERSGIVREKKACFNCLIIGHGYRACKYQGKCSWCGKKHVILMCRQVTGASTESKPINGIDEVSMANFSSEPEVFLQTLRVQLVNGERQRVVRAIIDTGSHRSYILGRTAVEMGYEVEGKKTMAHLLFGGSQTEPQEHKCYRPRLRSLDGSFACNFQAYEQQMICQNVGKVPKGTWTSELQGRGISLTDVNTGSSVIELLIGADVAGKLYTGRIVNLQCGATAIETRLGWTLLGKNNQNRVKRHDAAVLSLSMFASEANISRLWSLDVLGIMDPIEQKSKAIQQEEVFHKFRETVSVNAEGRYEVLLPWKENHPPLQNNRDSAVRRLDNTCKKLAADGLLLDYEKVLDEWLSEGIIEKVPTQELGETAYYLPHRHVIKEGSTTRIRPVFDASAKDRSHSSLNQCLEIGPNLIEFIPALLHRFRENRIGVISDIRKAFLQISIAPKERNVLRFLWRRSSSPEDIVEYRHCRVTFGVSSSPFLLGGTIELHLERAMQNTLIEEERDFLEKLKRSFYVDNCVTSLDSLSQLEAFRKTATTTMAEGGFDLRAWEFSNDSEERNKSPVLGLTWDKQLDVLQLSDTILSCELPVKITKRTILSVTQRVFDPLGMVSPTVLLPKLTLQSLWQTNLDWDSEVGDDVEAAFRKWHHELPLLREIKIQRWALGGPDDSFSLHLFVDASKEAYAAVIYARVKSVQGVKVEFIEAKSRVAPKERATIPRLELMAATVGARLLNSVIASFDRQHVTVHCWSDSSTTLAWIKRDNQWATFVFNRVQEIRKLTDPDSWRHVPGEQNPADLPSRGCTARQLIESTWLQGPSWLMLPESQWPMANQDTDETQISSELSKNTQKTKVRKPIPEEIIDSGHSLGAIEKNHQDTPWYLQRFSKYTKIVRLVAWIKRFLNNCRQREGKREKGEFTAKEIELAELALMRFSQRESFAEKKDPRLSTMRIYRDERGLLRLKSLVENREDTVGFRHPVILDPQHPLVIKLIEHHHEKLLHAHIDTVINVLREQVWILQCRRTVRTVIQRCVVCQRQNAKKIEPSPIGLPENRVRDARTFEITGTDFAGPLFLKDGSKVWICLFTCAIYRAVHLELVPALSTEKFLEALRRFIARRGRPSIIYADNATNYRGAYNILKDIDWEKVARGCSSNKIEWRFNPPSAPWWGGWWERLVRTIKELLRKVLKRAALTSDELGTILCDCEAVINARPLTYLAEDPQQLVALSPAMFLQDMCESGTPDIDAVDSRSLNKRQKYRQQLREHLRQRFRIEYLGHLSRRGTNTVFSHEVKVGDLVFCGSDNQKRLDWPLARVIQLYPGRDGNVRVVKIKTATGELIRPVQRLFPLELAAEQDLNSTADKLSCKKPHSDLTSPDASNSMNQSSSIDSRMSSSESPLDPENSKPKASEMKDDEVVEETTTRRGRAVKKPARYQD